jgi:hypothetical protein
MQTDIDFAANSANADAAIAVLVARTGCPSDCCRERLASISENDGDNFATGDLPATFVRTVDSFADEAGDLDCRC